MNEKKKKLNEEKQNDLARLIETIKTTLMVAFYTVGTSLQEIKDRKLFRVNGFKSFAEFIKEVFGWSSEKAYKYMAAARTYEALMPVVNKLKLPEPINESQIRLLNKYPDEVKQEVYTKACKIAGTEVPTAAIIEGVIANMKENEKKEVDKVVTAMRMKKAEANRNNRVSAINNSSWVSTEKMEGQFGCASLDLPWNHNCGPGANITASNQYNTEDFDKLAEFPLLKLLTPDACCFVWTTGAKLNEAIRLIEDHWKLSYKTMIVWHKPNGKTNGYWTFGVAEFLLIATQGSFPMPNWGDQAVNLVNLPKTKHSRKPKEFYEVIEQLTEGVDLRLELFARDIKERRPGWTYWGEEAFSSNPDNESEK